MRPERLSFFNEQTGAAALQLAKRTEVGARLRSLGARVVLGLVDLSDERAEAVKAWSEAGVPVDAWLLLDRAHGYFATPENVEQVEARVNAFLSWRERHSLPIHSLGFDFEPDLRELDRFFAQPTRMLAKWAWRTRDTQRLTRAAEHYARLMNHVATAGLELETFQFPLLLEDRAAKGRFFQRLINAMDVKVHREVFMVYTSLLGPLGPGLAESWTREVRSVAVGSTGGGIDPMPKLSFDELARDLRWAARVARDVRVFSLEGCVEHGYLERLMDLDWTGPEAPSSLQRVGASATRGFARGLSRLLR